MDNHFQDISPYTKWKVGNNLWTFDRPTTKHIRPEIEEKKLFTCTITEFRIDVLNVYKLEDGGQSMATDATDAIGHLIDADDTSIGTHTKDIFSEIFVE